MRLVGFLHVDPTGEQWLTAWHVDVPLATLLAAVAVGYVLAYAVAARKPGPTTTTWRARAFLAGVACLAIALLGPPDHYGSAALSAHMLQHMLLTLVAPPLILLGRPVQVVLRALGPRVGRIVLLPTLGQPAVRAWLSALTSPVVVAVLFNASLLVWHHPVLYQAAVQSRIVHDLEHASFVGSALLFWWVLVDPLPARHRLTTSAALLVLFASWMASDLLGAALTLARDPIYPLYAATPKPWDLTPILDQRLGGLIMWAGGGGFFAALIVGWIASPYLRRSPLSPVHRAP